MLLTGFILVGYWDLSVHARAPRWQSHRRSGLTTLPSVGAIP